MRKIKDPDRGLGPGRSLPLHPGHLDQDLDPDHVPGPDRVQGAWPRVRDHRRDRDLDPGRAPALEVGLLPEAVDRPPVQGQDQALNRIKINVTRIIH